MTATRILIVANTAWYLANFRLVLCRALLARGFEVIAVAPPGDDARRLEDAGVTFVPLAMDSGGVNPVKDVILCARFFGVLLRHKPAVCLSYTAKPNIYAGLVCRVARVPRIHNISGLGSAFIKKTWLTSVVQRLYRAALRGASCVFFQNPDDRALFLNNGLARAEQVDVLPGSGVDVTRFRPSDQVVHQLLTRPIRFLLSARMIWEKGVQEFVDASQTLRAAGLNVECWLLGPAGVHNPSAIARTTLDAWSARGTVRYLGAVQDVVPVLSEVDCVVLPSYREGVPRALLEASSMGLPVITTDAVGCREAVDNGITGMVCRVRDSSDLARCMHRMVLMTPAERQAMGRHGREKMVREFDEQIVIDRYLRAIDDALSLKPRGG